ncbi:MAG: tetraacyldisaccharide 4'-kinase, partial [Pyrinomonadaceae bacterium]
VGNITTGGTGKTPLAAFVANILAERGETVCILTRGYGRKDAKRRVLVSDGNEVLADVSIAGDEPFELAQKLLGKSIVIADADRVDAAEWARRRFGVTAFVLDDGFQHRKAKRDLDIVCIDATRPDGHRQAGSLRSGRMLPAGRLREPLHNLDRADVVVITRADLVDDTSNLRSEISDLKLEATIFTVRNKIVNVDEFRGERVFAFCGLGNPEGFYEQIQRERIDVAETKTFPDHHQYTQKDIDEVEAEAQARGAGVLVTTAKDEVKLSDLKFEMPRHVVRIEIEIDDAEAFAALL